MPGPSPRARGAVTGRSLARGAHGTIPACAGSSHRSKPGAWSTRDHPRVHGEQAPPPRHQQHRHGSSPRARGAVSEAYRTDFECRTIPACAGSSPAAHLQHRFPEDHPRVRGEQHSTPQVPGPSPGPSPRARGAGDRPVRRSPVGGTIPACAGSSPSRSGRRTRSRDHPRVRGEQLSGAEDVDAGHGPSPRARGAVQRPVELATELRTIPACAGSSSLRGRCPSPVRDHPRVRGEQARSPTSRPRLRGPSPRARGADGRLPVPVHARRTIPACAGSRRRHRCRPPSPLDHPRVRGEQRQTRQWRLP